MLVNHESTTGNPWRTGISEVSSNGWQSASARFLDELGNWKSVRGSRPGGGIAATSGSIFANQVNVRGNAGVGLAATLKVKVQTGTICDNEGGNFSAPGGKELLGEVSECDSDGDGISDAVETKASPSGDANQDGVLDIQQKHVAALPTTAGAGVVIASPNGTTLSNVANQDNPSSPDSPPGAMFPVGMVQFDVSLPTASKALKAALLPAAPSSNRVIQVELWLPASIAPTAYYVYGPTAEVPTNHWYRFDYDGVTGAVITGNRIVLHLVDGSRGDDDLTANNLIPWRRRSGSMGQLPVVEPAGCAHGLVPIHDSECCRTGLSNREFHEPGRVDRPSDDQRARESARNHRPQHARLPQAFLSRRPVAVGQQFLLVFPGVIGLDSRAQRNPACPNSKSSRNHRPSHYLRRPPPANPALPRPVFSAVDFQETGTSLISVKLSAACSAYFWFR